MCRSDPPWLRVAMTRDLSGLTTARQSTIPTAAVNRCMNSWFSRESALSPAHRSEVGPFVGHRCYSLIQTAIGLAVSHLLMVPDRFGEPSGPVTFVTKVGAKIAADPHRVPIRADLVPSLES